MNFIAANYESDNEDKSPQDEVNVKLNTETEVIQAVEQKMQDIVAAPDVDITDLAQQSNLEQQQKFESGFKIPKKVNHVSGHINYHNLNDFTFNEQLYTFHAYGFAQDPTDFTQNKIIGDKDRYNDQATSKSVFTGSGQREKQYRKSLKMRRMKYGNPATGDFMGPWAIYEGEEIFKNMSGELTEEQKEILKEIEEKRQKKIEDDKTNETKVLNVRSI